MQRTRNGQAHDPQFVVLCNRSIERLREYTDAMDRAQERAPRAQRGRVIRC